ncbi:hypothetical protein EON64_05770, partial [archaeon]
MDFLVKHLLLIALLLLCMRLSWQQSSGSWLQKGDDQDGATAGEQLGFSIAMSEDGISIAVGLPYSAGGSGTNRGVLRVLRWSGTAWVQRGSDIIGSSPNDNLGYAVAINYNGSIVATGAIGTGNKGAVRALAWSSAWGVLGGEINGDVNGDKFGYSVALNRGGNILAIGAPISASGGSSRGIVKVFQFTGGSWNAYGAVLSGVANGDQFGFSVALNSAGDVLAAGAPYVNSGPFADRGQVRVFAYQSSAWSQRGDIILGKAASDYAGWSVALNGSGSLLAVGSPLNDGINGADSGLVIVYSWNGTQYTQMGSDINGEAASDQFGYSVDLSVDGSSLVVGAPYNDATDGSSTSNRGSARVYTWTGSSWLQKAGDIDGETAGDNFGWSVAVDGNGEFIAVGAPLNRGPDSSATSRGSVRAYLFQESPSVSPTVAPTVSPTVLPTVVPTALPTVVPTVIPTASPTVAPSVLPTVNPTVCPTFLPTSQPSTQPSGQPTRQPSGQPTRQPSGQPSGQPTMQPSRQPSDQPTCQPTGQPSPQPTCQPSLQPYGQPTSQPIGQPTSQPSVQPSSQPAGQPSCQPTSQPSLQPSCQPIRQPSSQPSNQPSGQPTSQPVGYPTGQPSSQPTMQPSSQPSAQPTGQPSKHPSSQPTGQPSRQPSWQPSRQPSAQPSNKPSVQPSSQPSSQPIAQPSMQPSSQPVGIPTGQPSRQPSAQPSRQPSLCPTSAPSTAIPSAIPTRRPSSQPSRQPTAQPTSQPSSQPSRQPTSQPSRQPTMQPTSKPSSQPSGQPSCQPSQQPTTQPTAQPGMQPSGQPSCQP